MGVADAPVPNSDAVGIIQPLWIVGPELCVFGFNALGTPKPKGRPRATTNKKTGQALIYTPDTTVEWENQIGWQAKQAMSWIMVNRGDDIPWPFTKRVLMTLRFNMRRPASLPKRITHPLTGADVDNLEKCVLDALQNVNLIANDNLVTDLDAVKRFEEPGHPQGVEVEMTAWR